MSFSIIIHVKSSFVVDELDEGQFISHTEQYNIKGEFLGGNCWVSVNNTKSTVQTTCSI